MLLVLWVTREGKLETRACGGAPSLRVGWGRACSPRGLVRAASQGPSAGVTDVCTERETLKVYPL